jgi:Zn-dependent protease
MVYFEGRDETRVRAPRGSFRTSPIFIGLVVMFAIFSVLAWTGRGSAGVNVFFMVVSGWVISLCLHEFAHALVAYRAGDIGVAQRGYLQLNPLKYAHWLLSIALPILFIIAGGIALPGGAVLIDHQYIRDRRKESAISLAGPGVNLLITAVLVAPFAAGANIFLHPVFWSGLAYLAFFQLMAAIFNLLPIPGLDGGNAVLPWLSREWQRGFNAVRPYGLLIVFLILWQTHLGQTLVDDMARILVNTGGQNMGAAIYNGQSLFRFWEH